MKNSDSNNDNWTVKLTYSEAITAATISVRRFLGAYSRNDRFRTRWGVNQAKNGWQNNIMSGLSEFALAKKLNLFWSGKITEYEYADVGDWFEVRAVSAADKNHRLIMHKSDKTDRPYILAMADITEVHFVGWLYGFEGMKDEYIDDPVGGRPAFFIDQKYLRPMSKMPTERPVYMIGNSNLEFEGLQDEMV